MAALRSTLRVDFSKIPKRPPVMEATTFVMTKLGLSNNVISSIRMKPSTSAIFVRVKDQSLAIQTVEQNDGKHSLECDGKQFPIPITMVDNSVVVKVHDLSEDVSDKTISDFFSRYGEVRAIRTGVWSKPYPCAGIPDGYRYVTAIITKPVPSYVTIGGEETMVTYRGQHQTCRSCGLSVHHGMTCTQSRKLVAQKASVNERMSYSSALQSTSTDSSPPSRTSAPAEPANTESSPTSAPTVPVSEPIVAASKPSAPAVAPAGSTACSNVPAPPPNALTIVPIDSGTPCDLNTAQAVVSSVRTSSLTSTAASDKNRQAPRSAAASGTESDMETEQCLVSSMPFLAPRNPSPSPSIPSSQVTGKRRPDETTESDGSVGRAEAKSKRKSGRTNSNSRNQKNPPQDPKPLEEDSL